MTIWKEDFNRLPDDVTAYNELFPHTNVLFNERDRGKYIIDNSIIFDELPQGKKPKGSYDIFFAFGVEYPWIICNLLREKSISIDTYRCVINENLKCVAKYYYDYCVCKKYCSYDLSGLVNTFGVFYSKKQLMRMVRFVTIREVLSTLVRK